MRCLLHDIYCLIINYVACIFKHFLMDNYDTELLKGVLPSDSVAHITRHYFKEWTFVLFAALLEVLEK